MSLLSVSKVTLYCLLFNSGTTFPALSSLLAAWIPLKERSKLGSLVFGGGQVSIQINSNLLGKTGPETIL